MCCCWIFGVCMQVLWNLVKRIAEDVVVAVQKMCCCCWCWWCCGCHPRRAAKSPGGDVGGGGDGGGDDGNDPDYEYPRQECSDAAYRNVNREAAEALLDATANGTFIVRPATHAAAVGTLSVQQGGRIYHLAIRRRADGMLALGTHKPAERGFPDLNALINYYISNYLILYADNKSARTLLLPYNAPAILDVDDGAYKMIIV